MRAAGEVVVAGKARSGATTCGSVGECKCAERQSLVACRHIGIGHRACAAQAQVLASHHIAQGQRSARDIERAVVDAAASEVDRASSDVGRVSASAEVVVAGQARSGAAARCAVAKSNAAYRQSLVARRHIGIGQRACTA